MDYDEYLPHINVNDGKARIMNNMLLYITLLSKFKGQQMTIDLLNAIHDGDSAQAMHHAHALRGTAGNLGFPILHDITKEIEALCKNGQPCDHLCQSLSDSMSALEAAIGKFIDSPEV
ncbi:MAG: Hpt domain-containing protein [Defluviitaleaceae bacterium]|nr:Hpt domain-containing protein [Defluviitaleaceae bacterium]